jgi:glutathione S-transferase
MDPDMRLVGRLDSPYVRRVAISLRMMKLPFEHEALSVFRDFEAFAAINPLVKAPTLRLEDGTVLIDSTLILEYLERICSPDRRLTPAPPDDFRVSQRLIGLALAACEKSVQIVYETNLRPAEKRHKPWLDRVERQLTAAYDSLEAELRRADGRQPGEHLMQADITASVAWRFTRSVLPEMVAEDRYPTLHALSRRAEATQAFMDSPAD